MIDLFTALYCEASCIIRRFQLVKNPGHTRFQEFYNETAGIRLTVTGVGEIAAATAVSSACTEHPPAQTDILLSIGTCARKTADDGIFLCNKIIEQATGKTFYPDVLYQHPFQEETVVTGMLPYDVTGAGQLPFSFSEGALYDMEAAAVYQAGSYYYSPHQMLFLKLVSDTGTADAVFGEQVEQLMKRHLDTLCGFIETLRQISSEQTERMQIAAEPMKELLDRLCEDMHCSKVMRDSLRQHIRYLALTGTDVTSVIQEMYHEGFLPCKDKREGKMCFEKFKQLLFQ